MNKRKLLLLFTGGILAVGLFTGCMETTQTQTQSNTNANANTSNKSTNNARFKVEYYQERSGNDNNDNNDYEIIRDTKTGHAYLVRTSSDRGGMCELDETTSK